MGKTRANIELCAQLAIAIAVIVVAGVVVKRQLFTAADERTLPPTTEIGQRLNGWQQKEKGLVFFLQIGCSHCAEAAPFYRRAIEEAAKHNVSSIAVLPSSTEDSVKYLADRDLPISTVLQRNLSTYKIAGTPTVLFVDKAGTVRGRWLGYMAKNEKQMSDELNAFLNTESQE